jgi:hypothetical protein
MISFTFLLITPVSTVMLSACYVEWPMVFFILVGWYLAIKYLKAGQNRFAYFAGIFLGIASGMKYIAVPLIILLCFDLFFIKARLKYKPHLGRFILCLVIAFILLASPWMVRNIFLVGDPLYPLGSHFLSKMGLSTEPPIQDAHRLVGYSSQSNLWRWFPWVFHATADKVTDHRMHLGWPLLLIMIMLVGWRKKPDGPWITVILSSVFLFYLGPSPRIYFPIMILAWLFLPDFIQLFQNSRNLRISISLCLALLLFSSLPWIFHFQYMTYNKNAQDYFLGHLNDEKLLQKNGILTPILQWIRSKTPFNTRIWVWGEEMVF